MPAIIICGPKGSGKSTHAKALAAHYGKAQVIEADSCFSEWGNAEREFPADALVITTDNELARRPDAIHIKDACKAAALPLHPMLAAEESKSILDAQALLEWAKQNIDCIQDEKEREAVRRSLQGQE